MFFICFSFEVDALCSSLPAGPGCAARSGFAGKHPVATNAASAVWLALGSQANIPLRRTPPRHARPPNATNVAPACPLRLPAHCDERRPGCAARSGFGGKHPVATNAARAADALRRRCAGRRCLGSSSASSGSALRLRAGQTIRTALGRSQNLGLSPTRRPRRRGRSRARSAPGRSGPSGGPPRSSLP